MILLEYHNKIIEDTILDKLNNPPEDGKWESVEMTIADFDGITFHVFSSAEDKKFLNVSISAKCYSQLKQYGVEEQLKNTYGNYLVAPENGYDATVQVNLDQLVNQQDKAKVAHEIALLKRHILAAPFYKAVADIEQKKAGGLIEINYRDDEAFYLKPESDRLIVIFSIQFKDPDDVVFAKVFLQEYQDARRTMSNAPSVTYSQKEPPLELKGVRNLKVGDTNGFVSFVLFPAHITGNKKDSSINNIQTFRNYLHYHIKCSKAHLHTRMRNRVRTFLQILNRAKSDSGVASEKKTMSGRTFRRADDPQQESTEFNI